MAATINKYETMGRLEKAYKIAQVLHRADITPEQALLQTPMEWAITANCAGYVKGPSEETQRIVIEKLEGLYGPVPESPVCQSCGLPLAYFAGPEKGEHGTVCLTPGCDNAEEPTD
jgi:hypothetical protein